MSFEGKVKRQRGKTKRGERSGEREKSEEGREEKAPSGPKKQ
jgi:hypothetical protein